MGFFRRKKIRTQSNFDGAEIGAPEMVPGQPQAQDVELRHCPRCGSSGVTGGSDGTVTCSFCLFSFKVFSQPSHPFSPLSPEVPRLPSTGQTGDLDTPIPVAGGVQGDLEANPSEGGIEQFRVAGAEAGSGLDRFRVEGAARAVEYKERKFVTDRGDQLSYDSYIAHLAIRHSDDFEGVTRQVRASRGN